MLEYHRLIFFFNQILVKERAEPLAKHTWGRIRKWILDFRSIYFSWCWSFRKLFPESFRRALGYGAVQTFASSWLSTIAEEIALPWVYDLVTLMADPSTNSTAASASSEVASVAEIPVLDHKVFLSCSECTCLFWFLHESLKVIFFQELFLFIAFNFLVSWGRRILTHCS